MVDSSIQKILKYVIFTVPMEESRPIRLNLCAPLKYSGAVLGTDPFDCLQENKTGGNGAGILSAEMLLCFEIDGGQGGRIDPQADVFLGKPVFTGKGGGTNGEVCLPAGIYLFTQKRKMLCREECIATAIELQKNGLWERLKLENRLYIRYLFEDGNNVTQFFRLIIGT